MPSIRSCPSYLTKEDGAAFWRLMSERPTALARWTKKEEKEKENKIINMTIIRHCWIRQCISVPAWQPWQTFFHFFSFLVQSAKNPGMAILAIAGLGGRR
ncbi:hypothetical protein PG990_011129 [Apiospora arundinis]